MKVERRLTRADLRLVQPKTEFWKQAKAALALEAAFIICGVGAFYLLVWYRG